jgi:hypothetical protein
VAGVEAVLGEEVGLGDRAVAAREAVEDPAVRQGAARHGLDVAEVGAGEAQADGRVRAQPVGGFQDDETAPGAHEGGSGAQQLLEGFGECVRAGQAFGEFVECRQVRDPAGEPVLEEHSWCVRWGDR